MSDSRDAQDLLEKIKAKSRRIARERVASWVAIFTSCCAFLTFYIAVVSGDIDVPESLKTVLLLLRKLGGMVLLFVLILGSAIPGLLLYALIAPKNTNVEDLSDDES